MLSLPATPSLAAGEGHSGASEVTFLVQILLLLTVGRLLGEAMQRIGQPAVMGQLIAGVLLGPSVFGAFWPEAQTLIFPPDRDQKAMIDAVSQLGILMLLLLTGMETDLKLVGKVRRAALSVSLTGIAVPFLCGFALGELLPDSMLPRPETRLVTSLFLGTALSISSVKIVAIVVREMGFLRRKVGQVILAAAIIDDTIGWVIIAIIFGIALHGSLDIWSLGRSIVGVILFLALSFTVGRRLVLTIIRRVNDYSVSEVPVITAILVIMAGMALITNAIGVHTVLGAFVAGIIVGQSPILTGHIEEQLRGLIVALFMPVFFGLAGLGADLTILKDPHLLLLTAGLVLIASVGKFGGAFLGGTIGGLTRSEALALACGMNARGSTEVIVASIGLSMGALSQDLFTMVVAMAVLTTMAMPPMLRVALERLPLTDEERARIEQEGFEAGGFVPQLERILVAADGSATGKLASRLAGLIAGLRGMPMTVLQLTAENLQPELVAKAPLRAPEVGATAATQIAAVVEPEPAIREALDIEVAVTDSSTRADEAVAAEARKGFDLLVIGLGSTVDPQGGFHSDVTLAASHFVGPRAIVAARGVHEAAPMEARLNILVPVIGTKVSRRAAEVAFAIACASNSSVTAVYVSNASHHIDRRRRARDTREQDEAILKDLTRLGQRYGVGVHTAIRIKLAPEDAILRQARIGGHNLIIMGVTERPGERLAFGNVASAILESADCSVMFVAT
ncbi:cation:proton antiporter domain-containing protein [Microvirga alba]|uniref:Cation:proton antiporter n=1 Tax=Microvirga alba TaxID=2791025 RepID=A0A931BPX9_9HYPH|nr:cation:proton antiporter [Microvirga alba]MBF9232604.1 cation:proton antiporter [Microvirga alba]